MIAAIGCLFGIWSYPATRENESTRQALFLGFSFMDGLTIAPLVNSVYLINPSILTSTFFYTFLIFASFSFSALRTRRRSYMFLGGILGSLLSILFFGGLANMFLGSSMIYTIELYLGLFMFCGYVLYDTQLIVERVENGTTDFVGDSVLLFTDFIAVFVRLLIILSKKDEKKKKK